MSIDENTLLTLYIFESNFAQNKLAIGTCRLSGLSSQSINDVIIADNDHAHLHPRRPRCFERYGVGPISPSRSYLVRDRFPTCFMFVDSLVCGVMLSCVIVTFNFVVFCRTQRRPSTTQRAPISNPKLLFVCLIANSHVVYLRFVLFVPSFPRIANPLSFVAFPFCFVSFFSLFVCLSSLLLWTGGADVPTAPPERAALHRHVRVSYYVNRYSRPRFG